MMFSLVGLYGLVIGSFLNVVIYRLPIMLQKDWRKQCIDYLNLSEQPSSVTIETFNLVKPRSHCPNCQQPVKPWHNIPLISYLYLRGRCRNCQQRISWRYPLVELLSACLTIYLVWHFGISWQAAASLVFSWILLCLIFIDLDHQLLPDNLTLPLLWLGLLASIWQLFCSPQDAILGASLGYLSLWTVAYGFKKLTGREGMGHGDFKLLAALGSWTGWQLLPLIILISSLLGAIVGILLIVFRNHQRHAPIPFGPYLAIAGWVSLLWGKSLMDMYLQTLH